MIPSTVERVPQHTPEAYNAAIRRHLTHPRSQRRHGLAACLGGAGVRTASERYAWGDFAKPV
jgi:hypothetical protein